jgi:hypothetical protein
MIADRPTSLQQQRGWRPPENEAPSASPVDVAAARRLGLVLAVAVAAGVDLIVSIIQPPTPQDAAGSFVLFAGGIIPILAAAPFGWLLGEPAARTRSSRGAAIVVGMATGAMVLGDILTVSFIALRSVLESGASHPTGELAAGLIVMSVVGAMVLGPFVVALLTLPAAIAWLVAFRVAWTAIRPDGPD